MRWRGVECSYSDAELEMIRGWIEQAERGEVKPSEVANQWDVLQAIKLELGGRLDDERADAYDAFGGDTEGAYAILEELPAAFREGVFKIPDDVAARFPSP